MKNIKLISTKKDTKKCSTLSCQKQSQATCLNCKIMYCFKCSLTHAQNQQTQKHQIIQIPQAIQRFSKRCKILHKKLKSSIQQNLSSKKQDKVQETKILQTQMFEVQIKYLEQLQEKMKNIVSDFFKMIHLELNSLWQNYLTKFSSIFIDKQQQKLLQKLRKFSHPKEFSQKQYIKQYYLFDFHNSVEQICQMRQQMQKMHPQFPTIKVVQNYQFEIKQFLSKTFYNVDYKKQKINKKNLNIKMPNFLNEDVKQFPILPVQKKVCYLYDFQTGDYKIKKFQNLDYLPEYPRTIIVPNGDLHIIGGIQKDQILSKNHIVFRPLKNQVFKLSNLPKPVSPYNGLIYNDDAIYVIGGHTQKSHWDTQCLKFNLIQNKWQKIASMNKVKRNQSACSYNNFIYCFGISQYLNGFYESNIEKYIISDNVWKQIKISNVLSNPFNFFAAFDSIQINKDEILLFGGKKYLRKNDGGYKSDRFLCQQMFIYRPQSESFVQMGKLGMGIGVQYGQLNPIIKNNKIYSIQFLLSQSNPVIRWFETIQLIQIKPQGTVQSLMMFTDDDE